MAKKLPPDCHSIMLSQFLKSELKSTSHKTTAKTRVIFEWWLSKFSTFALKTNIYIVECRWMAVAVASQGPLRATIIRVKFL